jgi:ribosomal protein S18 acetylase RimI-like enzyme
LEIRDAQPADARAIAEVLVSAFEEFEAQYTPAAYEATILSPEIVRDRISSRAVIIAVEEDTIAGTVTLEIKDDGAHVRSMAVRPSYRGRGVARALLTEVERRAKEQGLTLLKLSTTPFLEAAIRLYRAHGYEDRANGKRDMFGTALIPLQKRL